MLEGRLHDLKRIWIVLGSRLGSVLFCYFQAKRCEDFIQTCERNGFQEDQALIHVVILIFVILFSASLRVSRTVSLELKGNLESLGAGKLSWFPKLCRQGQVGRSHLLCYSHC